MKTGSRKLRFYLLLPFVCAAALAAAQPSAGGYLQTDIRDLVLIYQGGVHRMDFNADQLRPYVVHENRFGQRDWLFDGFLFLEFDSGRDVSFQIRRSAPLAKKTDWEWLIDRHFAPGKGISALDECIGQEIAKLGPSPFRHRVVIAIPEPPLGQKDWGELDGRKLDFADDADRIRACEWYIDLLNERFRSMGYEHIELSGFYWLPEIERRSQPVTQALGAYIRERGKRFYWIPYYTAQGYSEWKDSGFDAAYLQPTYFWNRKIGDERVDRACELAYTYNMGLEMEFDMAASVKSPKQLRDRGMRYMSSFRKNGVYRSASIAYYEGGAGMYHFTKVTEPADREFIDTLAWFIQNRRHRMLDGADPDFRDDFAQKRLDTAQWNVASADPLNVSVKKNRLVLRGNAQVDTRGRADLMYGTIGVRARLLATGKGVKAKIRMMPLNEKLGPWPASGDMFLMDYDGDRDPEAVACGVNTKQMNEVNLHNIKESLLPVRNLDKVPHTFTCKWTERDIVFKVDGVTANIQEDLFDREGNPYYPQGWPFNDDRFYLEISTSSPGGKPVLEIEYVEILPD